MTLTLLALAASTAGYVLAYWLGMRAARRANADDPARALGVHLITHMRRVDVGDSASMTIRHHQPGHYTISHH